MDDKRRGVWGRGTQPAPGRGNRPHPKLRARARVGCGVRPEPKDQPVGRNVRRERNRDPAGRPRKSCLRRTSSEECGKPVGRSNGRTGTAQPVPACALPSVADTPAATTTSARKTPRKHRRTISRTQRNSPTGALYRDQRQASRGGPSSIMVTIRRSALCETFACRCRFAVFAAARDRHRIATRRWTSSCG
jgi:hypothetical protein